MGVEVRLRDPAAINVVTGSVIRAAIDVQTALGPRLREVAYRRCMGNLLAARGHVVEQEVPFPLAFRDIVLEDAFRVDILVDRSVVVELKAVQAISKVDKAQLLTYLKLSGMPVGLLLNFNDMPVTSTLKRYAGPSWKNLPRPRETLQDARHGS